MITYREIYEAAKKERCSENLQPISKTFIQDVAEFLKEKKEEAFRSNDVFSETLIRTKKQLENSTTLFNELLRRRRKKICNLVLIASETGVSKQDFENMFTIEKTLFEELLKCFEVSDRKLNELMNGAQDDDSQKNILIAFTESSPEFVAPTGEKYGPYEKSDFANIPKDIADIFISDNKAVSMEK